MLRAIGRRQHNNYAIQASFHGIKIPLRDNVELLHKRAEADFNPADEAMINDAFEQMKKRKRGANG